jgi:hypothetical protein
MLELLTPADAGVVSGFRPPTRSVGSDKSAQRATSLAHHTFVSVREDADQNLTSTYGTIVEASSAPTGVFTR